MRILTNKPPHKTHNRPLRPGFPGRGSRARASAALMCLAVVIALMSPGARADGLTGEVKLTRLNWGTSGNELNSAGLSGLFNREIDINTLAIDTWLGYRFDHNRSISTAVGFLYGRGLTKTHLTQFGMGSLYHFKSWFGLGYKGFYNIIQRPNLDLFWHLSLVDFNLDSTETIDNKPGDTRTNGLFSGWGYGLGLTITQFMISYHAYNVGLGPCGNCPGTRFHTISLGWQFN